MFNAFSMIADMDSDTQVNSQKNKPVYVFDSNGNINFEETFPDYKILLNALKSGISWYDIIYPNGEITSNNSATSQNNPTDDPTDDSADDPENEWVSVKNKGANKSADKALNKRKREHNITPFKPDHPNKRPCY
jgi:hypothetical protein